MLLCRITDAESEVNIDLHPLEHYIQAALGIAVTTTPWHKKDCLPHFIRELYDFADTKMLGIPFLLAIDTTPGEQSPATVRKHMDLLRAKQSADVIYVRANVTAYNRKRLIEHKVPFIVPGNQMYLPALAIDLREHFRRIRSQLPTFSPSTQAVVIHALLRGCEQVFNPLETAQRMGYSAMTMTRVFDELEAAGLGDVTFHGRERHLRFTGNRREIWTRAQPLLRSPANKRLFIRHAKGRIVGIRAGLAALAEYSMLARPALTTYAISREEWKLLRQRHKAVVVPDQDPHAHEIEVWGYPPALLTELDVVDPLSLYLSLKDNPDERIMSSLEEMMEKLEW